MKKNRLEILSIAFLTSVTLKCSAQCPVPTSVTASPNIICGSGSSNLNATAGSNAIRWFTVPTGGSQIGTSASGANFAVSPVNTTTYYAESFSPAVSFTFNYTGGLQSYTVPPGITTLTVDVRGAQGGSGFPNTSAGGQGGRTTGTISVTPGQVIQINVGGAGANGLSSSGGAGGFNGGGIGALYSGSYAGGGGGGASDIRISPFGLANRLAIAGGGGGGAYNASTVNYDRGGNGGGLVGENGYSNNSNTGTGPGGGGTQSSGGVAGFWSGYCGGNAGVLGIGGNGGPCTNSGGGGGGGYYGGGGGVWSGGGGGSSFLAAGSFTQGSQTGNGLVIITADGCTSSSRTPVTVLVSAIPTIAVNSGTICNGSSFTITPSGASTYTIQGGNSIVNPSSNSTYTVTGTSAQGCIGNIATCNVTVNTTPTISVNSGTICSGNSFTISPSGASTYTIQGGSAVVNPNTTASYTVSGTAANGCVANVATSNVNVNATPTITVNSGAICSGSSFTITPNGASTYTIQGGNSVVSPSSTAVYTITGTATNGCVGNVATGNVTVNTNPTITAVSNQTNFICSGQSANLTASGASTYSWSNASTGANISVSPTVTTTYTVTGTSAQGCVANAVVSQSVSACTGIQNVSSSNSSIVVYPNPTNGILNIELTNVENTSLAIINILGKVVLSEKVISNTSTLNIQGLASGIYFVQVVNNNKVISTQKIIKQ